MVGLWWCACHQYVCVCLCMNACMHGCIGIRTLSSFALFLFSAVTIPVCLPFHSGVRELLMFACAYLRYGGNGKHIMCSLKMAYVSHSLFLSFVLSLSCFASVIHSPPVPLSHHRLPWIQCRLHISLYIPRVCLCVLCYPLTLLHMQFLWSHSSISVTKYTHAHARTTKWRAVVVVVAADFCIFKCADLPKKKNEKENITHKSVQLFFCRQLCIFISNIASHPNIA